MAEIRIVEYDNSLAKAIADMWNRSGSSWGGNSALRTEESIILEHENAALLTVFIAMDGDEAVGYCSFSEYQNDEGALFIPLLNVRPDYHGKKVGKTLVRKAVERTVGLGWPRLDLFTWPGNIKAVPVYKKCGFFWEERDDSTHLMNFIPTILKTEAFTDFFNKAHWYEDSKRVIEIKPDGVKENGFTYFEYKWEKAGSHLRVQFEKTARGMRLVETDDYLISASVDDHDLVFGRSYKIKYHLTNKTGALLEVSIKGTGDKNIEYDFETKLKVEGTVEVEGEFSLGEIDKEQNTWRTHPAVVSEIFVNGKGMTYKTGIEPKFPAGVYISSLPVERYLNSDQEFYLEIENHFNETAVFTFELPHADFIKFDRSSFEVELKAKERKSIILGYSLSEFGAYEALVPFTVRLVNGETVCFKKRLTQAFRGQHGKAAWNGEYAWYLFNGPFMAALNKNNNYINISNLNGEGGIGFAMPKLGRPYSSEFSRKSPEKVEFDYINESACMKAYYYPEDFKGLELIRVIKLYSNGIFEQHYEINNLLDTETSTEVCLDVNVNFHLYKAVLPYEGRYLELNHESESDMRFWDGSKVTENWLFSKGDKLTRGLCWPESAEMKFAGWTLSFEKNFGKMKAGESATSDKVTAAFGTYSSWQDFKAFAIGKWTMDKPLTAETLELILNGGNPFTAGTYDVVLKDNKSTDFVGGITLNSRIGAFQQINKNFCKEDQTRNTVFNALPAKVGYDSVLCSMDFESQAFDIKAGIFGFGKEPVKLSRARLNDMDTYQADNGIVKIAASPDFSSGIFSMIYNGREWLDTLFPKRGPKSWWNPFVGGICSKPEGMTNISIVKETMSGDIVNVKDNMGNSWSGIKISVKVTEHEEFKGLEYHQYFLMLPELPVICHVTGVTQNTGRFFAFAGIETECFFKPGEALVNSWLKAIDNNGDLRTYKAGKTSMHIGGKDSIIVGSKETTDMLQVYVNKEKTHIGSSVDVNTISAHLSGRLVLRDGESCTTNPGFFVFTGHPIDAREMKSLRNISFDL